MSRDWTLVERRWHGLDDGVLAYALAAMRSLWVWPALHVVARGVVSEQTDLLAPLAVFGLLAGGTMAAQCGTILLTPTRRTMAAVAVVGLAAVVLVLYLGVGRAGGQLWDPRWLSKVIADPKRSVFTLLPAVWLWWWGLLAGRATVCYDGLARNFALGLAALLLLLALSTSLQIMATGTMLAILLAFLALGLFILALASIQDARRYESVRADHDLPLARHWWGTVGTIVAALLLAALLLSRLFLPETLSRLGAGVAAGLAFLGQIFAWLLLVISYPIFKALEWLTRLLGLGQRDFEPPQLTLPPSFAEQFGDLKPERAALDPSLQTPLQIAGGVLVAALILLLFLLALRRFRTFLEDDVAETRESILSLDLLKAQLAQLLRRRGANKSAPSEPFVALGGDDPNHRVRRTYQALLAWAAAEDHARPPGMTPDRYQRLLIDAYPQHGTPLEVITAAYGVARYGATPVLDEHAVAVTTAWQQILDSRGRKGHDVVSSTLEGRNL